MSGTGLPHIFCILGPYSAKAYIQSNPTGPRLEDTSQQGRFWGSVYWNPYKVKHIFNVSFWGWAFHTVWRGECESGPHIPTGRRLRVFILLPSGLGLSGLGLVLGSLLTWSPVPSLICSRGQIPALHGPKTPASQACSNSQVLWAVQHWFPLHCWHLVLDQLGILKYDILPPYMLEVELGDSRACVPCAIMPANLERPALYTHDLSPKKSGTSPVGPVWEALLLKTWINTLLKADIENSFHRKQTHWFQSRLPFCWAFTSSTVRPSPKSLQGALPESSASLKMLSFGMVTFIIWKQAHTLVERKAQPVPYRMLTSWMAGRDLGLLQ